MKPFLKWVGGKSRLVPDLRDAMVSRCMGCYFEPFLGSGAFMLSRLADGHVQTAVATDANDKLIWTWEQVRSNVDAVVDELSVMPVDEKYKLHYNKLRTEFRRHYVSSPRLAALFIWINHACYNGLYRESERTGFNVPVGRYDRVAIPTEEHLRAVSRLIQQVEFLSDDFEPTMKRAVAGDQAYCDPPYVPANAGVAGFTGYSEEMGWSQYGDTRRLAAASIKAAERGVHVVLTNHDTPHIREVFFPAPPFKHLGVSSLARQISAGTRGRAREIVISIG